MVWPTLGSRTAKEQEQEQYLGQLSLAFLLGCYFSTSYNLGKGRHVNRWT